MAVCGGEGAQGEVLGGKDCAVREVRTCWRNSTPRGWPYGRVANPPRATWGVRRESRGSNAQLATLACSVHDFLPTPVPPRSFVAWRDTLQNVLLQTLLQGVRDSWQASALPEGAPPPSAQQLLAR